MILIVDLFVFFSLPPSPLVCSPLRGEAFGLVPDMSRVPRTDWHTVALSQCVISAQMNE